MIMSRFHPTLRNTLILHCITKDHTLIQLISFTPKNLLPGRLALGHCIATIFLKFLSSPNKFLIVDEDIDTTLIQVDT